MMVKVALYGLIRVEFQWLGATPRWLGLALLAIGLLSSLGGVLWALIQHDLKRLLAYSSIENVGIIALGLGASMLFADAGERDMGGDRVRGGAAARHRTTRSSRRSCSSARARSSGPPEAWTWTISAGCLQRMPWAGGAFLVGAMAIAGPAAAQRLRVGVARSCSRWCTSSFARRWVSRSPARSRSPASPRPPRSRCSASLKVLGLTLLGEPRTRRCAGTHATLPPACGRRWSRWPLMCIALGFAARPGAADSRGARPRGGGSTLRRPAPACRCPGTGSYPRWSRSRSRCCVLSGAILLARGRRRAAPRRAGRAGSPSSRRCAGPRRASQSP